MGREGMVSKTRFQSRAIQIQNNSEATLEQVYWITPSLIPRILNPSALGSGVARIDSNKTGVKSCGKK